MALRIKSKNVHRHLQDPKRPAQRLDPERKSFRDVAGRRLVETGLFSPDPRLAVILAFGQSNIANECDPAGLYAPSQGVYNYNLFDGRCYVARDPLLGPTGNRSNVATRLADLLVCRGRFDRVLLVPIGYGGSAIAEWATGGRLSERLVCVLNRLQRVGITATHALWQQGETEASRPDADGTLWVQQFASLISTVRQHSAAVPIYVAQCTVCRNSPNDVIRAAQRSVVSPENRVLAGPDLDCLGPDQRWDGCHFSVGGLENAAELWFRAMDADTSGR